VLNAVDGCIPSDMATGRSEDIEEERRLLYVAMTRAKDTLDLLVPQKFYVHQQSRSGDRHLYASRTRFIPPAMLDRFEAATWPVRRRQDAVAAGSGANVDLKARLGGMWKART
jgi:DNA helicase-2/ATP-dependent DNA helicase PcrA